MFVIPSRGRPQNIRRLIDAVEKTSSGGYRFMLMLDYDDPSLGGYPKADELPVQWERMVQDRRSLSSIYNTAFVSLPKQKWYGIFADDVEPQTQDWDKKLVEAAGSNGMAFGDDGIGSPTHFVLGGDLVREKGWLALPGLQRLYIDTVWRDIAFSRGVLNYLPDVHLIHLHPSVGKGMMDATYKKSPEIKASDKQCYEEFIQFDLLGPRR